MKITVTHQGRSPTLSLGARILRERGTYVMEWSEYANLGLLFLALVFITKYEILTRRNSDLYKRYMEVKMELVELRKPHHRGNKP